MLTLDEILDHWIPYRIQALDTFLFAWDLTDRFQASDALSVSIGEATVLRGNVASIANPMIEAGMIHARALLEFIGLRALRGRLVQIDRRRPGDVAVEHYRADGQPLRMATPASALAAYGGPPEEAEAALVSIIELAGKYLAHLTTGSTSSAWTDRHLKIALHGIPVLIDNHLYVPLGRQRPPAPSARPPAP